MTPARFVPGGDLCHQILTSRPNPAVMAQLEPIEPPAEVLEPMYVLIGWARSNGAGEIVFRQAGHPEHDKAINELGPWSGMWKAVYVKREKP